MADAISSLDLLVEARSLVFYFRLLLKAIQISILLDLIILVHSTSAMPYLAGKQITQNGLGLSRTYLISLSKALCNSNLTTSDRLHATRLQFNG